jgi:His-Xaa-Ser system protein HxsD
MTAELPWVQSSPSGLTINVDVVVYPLEVVLRACHTFTNRCYVFPRTAGEGTIAIDFVPRDSQTSLDELVGAFTNILLDFRLRDVIAAETRTIRELLVAQAFCEADLLDRRQSESDEYDDPRGIVR